MYLNLAFIVGSSEEIETLNLSINEHYVPM